MNSFTAQAANDPAPKQAEVSAIEPTPEIFVPG